ncbi:CPBP family glutamic-type intramembrane protease [Dyadobacter tibetensis]|uniref:CPBP family glutamic-type intramembrane protease n=1 Tax=Dyadobacter tibetensis TaxID=1211851 RepID=UPI000471611C|nr:CPBP family glutamic-type intramembrane protease [Dyadobacter tibetensis]
MIQEIFEFFKKPYSFYSIGENQRLKERIFSLKNAYFFCLCSTFIIVLIIAGIEMFLRSKFGFSISKNLTNGRKEFLVSNSPFIGFLKLCIIGPLNEEIMFRLPLITKNKFLRYIIFAIILEYIFPQFFQLHISFLQYNIALFVILAIILFSNSRYKGQTYFFQSDKRSNYLCWILIIVFSLIHLGNFTPIYWSYLYIYPIYILPQFMYGIVFSFFAIKYNSFFLPFFLHVTINVTPEIFKWFSDLF